MQSYLKQKHAKNNHFSSQFMMSLVKLIISIFIKIIRILNASYFGHIFIDRDKNDYLLDKIEGIFISINRPQNPGSTCITGGAD